MTGPCNCLSNFTVINYACWRSNITEIDIVWEVSRELKFCKCIFGWPLTCLMFSSFSGTHAAIYRERKCPRPICDRSTQIGARCFWGTNGTSLVAPAPDSDSSLTSTFASNCCLVSLSNSSYSNWWASFFFLFPYPLSVFSGLFFDLALASNTVFVTNFSCSVQDHFHNTPLGAAAGGSWPLPCEVHLSVSGRSQPAPGFLSRLFFLIRLVWVYSKIEREAQRFFVYVPDPTHA